MAYQSKLIRNIGDYFINITLFLTLFNGLNCYNVEVNKVGISRGQLGSQFGYSVAFVRAPGWTSTFEEKEFYPKQLLVGAPNLQYDNIKAHGQISGCAQPDKSDLDCYWLNVTDISNMCQHLKRTDTEHLKRTDTDCALDSRLGATLAVNRQFPQVRVQTSTVPMVTVCAPGWKNVYPEIDPHRYQNYMIGMCLKLREDLRPLDCGLSGDKKYCFPYWAGNDGTTTSPNGRPVYSYAQGGMSAAFTKDGLSEITGGPGADDSRGAYIAHQKNWVVRRDIGQGNTLYFGYSLDTGMSMAGEFVISGMPNYYSSSVNGHFGKFEVYKGDEKRYSVEFGITHKSGCNTWPLEPELLKTLIKTEQMGSKFGASVATVDLTGDGYDELVVGAPLYSETRPEEGRVFVYMFDGSYVCGPIGVLSGGAKTESLEAKTAFARFGSALASAGDLDLDGNKDLAVGAPYEDDGQGAVYIYRGIGNCMCQMKDVFSQRIAGASVDPGIRSFGWSIYGDEDVDDNSFPDLAVGAYESDTAVVLRSRPIVNVDVEMVIAPSPIPLNGSQLQCSRDKEELCFNVTVLFQFTSVGRRMGNVSHIMITWKLESDTFYKKEKFNSRVEFNGTAGLGSITENITLSSGQSTVKTYTLYVKKYNGKPEPQDAWTKVHMEGTYELVPLSGQAFELLDPILSTDAHTLVSESVEFDKKCDNLDECTSDLSLNVEMFLLKRDSSSVATKVDNNTVIYVDAFSELEVTTEVKNAANSSYKSKFTGQVGVEMRREVSSYNGRINATCKYELMTAPTRINCLANSKLDENENFKVKSIFDISSQRLVPEMDINRMRQNISIQMQAGQANTDTTPNNNDFERTIKIALKYNIHIEEDKENSDQVRYQAEEKSTRRLRLVHTYYIFNEGPSFLPMSYVNISIPVKKKNVVLASIMNHSANCDIRESGLELTTTQNPGQSTGKLTIPRPGLVHRRRQAEGSEQTAAATDPAAGSSNNSRNITCEEYECVTIECLIVKLGKKQQQTIDVTIDLSENEIAKIAKANQDVRQIRYLTTATLTDPTIWFGGKVVPLEKTAYAEKWTTLIVEPTSLVPEVNIWIIIGSVLGAVLFLVIVILICWRCGFFARTKHYQVQQWKSESLYNRKSIRLSKASGSKQPYTSVDEKEKEPPVDNEPSN